MYYAKVFKKDLGRGLEILSDILMNSLIDANAVHRERDVILREMEEVNKQQEEVRATGMPCCARQCGAQQHDVGSADRLSLGGGRRLHLLPRGRGGARGCSHGRAYRSR